jgi:RNA recognition motif-containing protein
VRTASSLTYPTYAISYPPPLASPAAMASPPHTGPRLPHDSVEAMLAEWVARDDAAADRRQPPILASPYAQPRSTDENTDPLQFHHAPNDGADEAPTPIATVLAFTLESPVPDSTGASARHAGVVGEPSPLAHHLNHSAGTRDSNDLSLGSRAGFKDQVPLEGECNLIVAGLTREVDDEGLRTLFAPYGGVISSTVMRHVGTGVSRGFGFVLFSRQSEGEAAIAGMHGARCGPNTLNVHKSHHDGTIVETNAVFVRNLPLDVSVARVHDFFKSAGEVLNVLVASDTGRDAGDAPNGRRYKVATVTFADVETARNAVRTLHNRPFPALSPVDESPLVIVKFAESPEYRKRRHAQRPRLSQSQSNLTHSGTASLRTSTTSMQPYGFVQVPTPMQSTGSLHAVVSPPVFGFAPTFQQGQQAPVYASVQPPSVSAAPYMFAANMSTGGQTVPSAPVNPMGMQGQLVYMQGPNGQMVPVFLPTVQQQHQQQQQQPPLVQQQHQPLQFVTQQPAPGSSGSIGGAPWSTQVPQPMFSAYSAGPFVHP